jgi:hypothetical protein
VESEAQNIIRDEPGIYIAKLLEVLYFIYPIPPQSHEAVFETVDSYLHVLYEQTQTSNHILIARCHNHYPGTNELSTVV